MSELTQRTYLVDASPYIFRAFFSLPSKMKDAAGRQSNAVYGFARFLLKLLTDEQPEAIVICFDGSLTTSFRNDLYPDYKKQRELPPKSLEDQLGRCQEVVVALGLASFIDPTYEADDLIATLCAQSLEHDRSVTIVTSDKDMAQLVEERVDWLDAGKGQRLDISGVQEKLGVRPEQVPDLLALAGDTVDNIPGVRGIGAKTAIRLLGLYPDLEAIYQNLDQIPESGLRGARSLAARLEQHEAIARLSRQLAVVVQDALPPGTLDTLAPHQLDRERFRAFCADSGFATLPDFLP